MTETTLCSEARSKTATLATKIIAIVLAASLGVAGAAGLAGCSADNGDVAATMQDLVIYEDDVTAYIESIREDSGYTDDTTWALILSLMGYTPETYREAVIQDFCYSTALYYACEQQGLSVTDEEIDEAIQTVMDAYGYDEDSFETILENSGYTMETYREAIEASLLEDLLYDLVCADVAVDDEYFEENGMTYVSYYYSDIKRSSHILFEDEETAEAVLAQLQAGEITFEEAVAEYSIDTASAEDGGDVGWSGVHTFVDEYQAALDELSTGEMSGVVESEYGYHIILCTDEFVYSSDETTVDGVPEEVYDAVCDNYLLSSLKQSTYLEYIEGIFEELGLTINDMPEGLSYDVDIEALLYSDDEAEDSTDDTTEDSTDDTTEDSTEDATDDTTEESTDDTTEDSTSEDTTTE